MSVKNYKRTDRVSILIQRTLTNLLQSADPYIKLPKFITISFVKLSKDLSQAKIYFTILQGDSKEVAKTLNDNIVYFRKGLAKDLNLRIVPNLRFLYDESIAYATHLIKLIDES